MSDSDDLYDVTQPPISEELAEQLLSGSNLGVEPTSAAAQLGALFSSVKAPADSSELAGLDAVISAFHGAVVTPAAGQTTARTRPMIKKLLTGKALATLGALTLVSAGAAAAATGAVPSPFSSDNAKEVTTEQVPDQALENVDSPADGTDDDAADETTESTEETTESTEAAETTESTEADAEATEADADLAETDSTEAIGPDATGPAKFGLCTAYAAHADHETDAGDAVPTESTEIPVPFQNLEDAAKAAGQTVEEFCADATPGQSSAAPGHGDESPSATAPGHTGDNPSVTAPGHTGDNPSVTAPGHTGDNPSVTAPGQAADNPSATAPGQANNPSATAPGQAANNPSATAPASGPADNPSATAPASGPADNPSVTAPGATGGHGSGHGSSASDGS